MGMHDILISVCAIYGQGWRCPSFVDSLDRNYQYKWVDIKFLITLSWAQIPNSDLSSASCTSSEYQEARI